MNYWLTIFSLALLIIVYFGLIYLYFPYRKYKNMYKTYTQLGFKVYIHPWDPIGMQYVRQALQCNNKYKDGLYLLKRKYKQYDFILNNLFSKIFIVFIKPRQLKEVFSLDSVDLYPKQSKTFLGLVNASIGSGIGFYNGVNWHKKHLIVQQLVHPNFLKQNTEKIIQIASLNINQIPKKCQIDIFPFISSIYSDITNQLFFSQRFQKNIQGIKNSQYLLRLIDCGVKLGRFPQVIIFGPKILNLKYRKDFREMFRMKQIYMRQIKQLLKKRLENKHVDEGKGKYDLLNKIKLFNQNPDNEKFKYTEDDIIGQYIHHVFAGSISATHLSMGVIYIIKVFTEVYEKLMKQIDQNIKTSADMTFDKIKSLKYLDSVIKQTIRFYGPINGIFPRITAKDHYMGKLPIQKGTVFTVMTSVNHFNPDYFKEPFEFIPERWLDSNFQSSLPLYAYTGFGGGPRGCVGKSLALYMTKISLIRFLQSFNYELSTKDLKYEYIMAVEIQRQKLKIQRK